MQFPPADHIPGGLNCSILLDWIWRGSRVLIWWQRQKWMTLDICTCRFSSIRDVTTENSENTHSLHIIIEFQTETGRPIPEDVFFTTDFNGSGISLLLIAKWLGWVWDSPIYSVENLLTLQEYIKNSYLNWSWLYTCMSLTKTKCFPPQFSSHYSCVC